MSGENGQSGKPEISDEQRRIAALENRIYELMDQVEKLTGLVNKREGEIRALVETNNAIGRNRLELQQALRQLADYCASLGRGDFEPVPEHLAHYASQAHATLKGTG